MTRDIWEQCWLLYRISSKHQYFKIDQQWEFHLQNMLHILLSTIKNNYNLNAEAGKYWEILFKQRKQSLLLLVLQYLLHK